MKIQNSCISWYGGKGSIQQRRVLDTIINLINDSNKKIFVDVFGGSGVVIINIQNKIKKYNDINKDLYNFFRILKDEKLNEELTRKLTLTLYSENDYKNANNKVLLSDCNNGEDLDRAINFYIATMQSCNSVGANRKSGFKTSKKVIRRGMSQAVSAWLRNVDENLPEVIERFREIEVFCYDFLECIDKFDSYDTIFYLDPPYHSESRKNTSVYKDEVDNKMHKRLVDRLLEIKGQAILSGYENYIYEKLIDHGWSREKISIKTTSGHGEKKDKREECIWYNWNDKTKI